MADELKANYGKDTGSGSKLKTGSLRRKYNSKKKKSKSDKTNTSGPGDANL